MRVLMRPGSEIENSPDRNYRRTETREPIKLEFTPQMVTELFYGQKVQLWIDVGGEEWRLPIYMPPGCWPRGTSVRTAE